MPGMAHPQGTACPCATGPRPTPLLPPACSRQQLIAQLWRQHGFTLVLVTHDVAEASALADRIVVIEHGQVGLEVAVPAPHPRLPGTPAIAAIQAQVLSRLLGPPSPGAAAAAEAQPGAAAQVGKPLRRFA